MLHDTPTFHGTRQQLINALNEMLIREKSPQKKSILEAAVRQISELSEILSDKPV